MFGLFKKKPVNTFDEIRELLFGDVPLADWRPQDGKTHGEPWTSFESARAALNRGDSKGAVEALRHVLGLPGLESRQCLQAWSGLRELGVQPGADEAKRVHGVVLEVHLKEGLDTLAAYADHTARYINHSDRLLVWEKADAPAIAGLIDGLIGAGQQIVNVLGPWDQARRPAPLKRHARLNMLTASGLHFGEGPFDALSQDPMGGPIIAAGAGLMKALI